MKKSLLVLSIIFTSLIVGCSTDGAQVEAAVSLCKDKGGVTEMYHEFNLRNVKCQNGSYFANIGKKPI
mgnify:CR=1 FL=1|tara:strand:- start:325 stop:528 length:204 start_codon:yes stop_codon:yes gene_type:complete